ncbi:MAG: RnfABCDGE type electron transport complex subunit A [Bacilli bacterium]|nr:RnfABCDGE type electron transport complex subunit A [Bacilli bacterium]
MSIFTIFITALVTENVILTKFLGICSFLGTSNKEKNAIGMGISVTFVVLVSTILTYLINKYILIPTNSTYLQTITFILVIACFVQITELVIKRYFKSLYKSLGIYLPLITTNCAVLGIILTNIRSDYNFIESIFNALGSSLGFVLVLYIFALLRDRIEKNNIIKSFKGIPIALITAGIMALIFGRLV